jgi:hypothetical protein
LSNTIENSLPPLRLLLPPLRLLPPLLPLAPPIDGGPPEPPERLLEVEPIPSAPSAAEAAAEEEVRDELAFRDVVRVLVRLVMA